MRTIEKLSVQLASKTIEFSEYKTYYEVLNRVCYYNYANGNGVVLPYDETSLEKAQTLVDMPVQAKYTVNAEGLPDLLDHCVSIDENGNYQFNTVSVGVHTAVEIREDTVETFDGNIMTLPCLFAKAKIWRRYDNYCAAIKRLFDENTLNNSWEISSFSYEYKDGVKTLGDYVFEGNAYLGGNVLAAYRDASKVLEMSNQVKQAELLVASALSADLIEHADSAHVANDEEENMLEGIENVVVEETKPDAPDLSIEDPATAPVENPIETIESQEEVTNEADIASLTLWDLERKINQACKAKIDAWCYVAFWFPAENTVWVRSEVCEQELDYLLFTYDVSEENVSVSEPTPVRLTVSVASINESIDGVTQELVNASAKIDELSSQVEALSPFKAAYEQAEAEKAKAAREALIESMRQDAIDSECFSAKELDSEDPEGAELKEIFESADADKLKILISDRILSKLRQSKSTETATIKVASTIKVDLVNESNTNVNYLEIAKNFLK